MRIIIDGTVGSGKTSIIRGISQRDPEGKKFPSLTDLGYPIFSDMVISVISEMRQMNIPDPSENWDLFFTIGVRNCIRDYHAAPPNTLTFYDRGVYYFEILARKYKCKLPDTYYDFINTCRYDEPVFIFEPIVGLDMSKPHSSDNKQKVYSLNDRINQHHEIIQLYKHYGYETIVVPTMYDDPWLSADYRMSVIKEVLGL